MNRRNLLSALAALPFVGKLLPKAKAEPVSDEEAASTFEATHTVRNRNFAEPDPYDYWSLIEYPAKKVKPGARRD